MLPPEVEGGQQGRNKSFPGLLEYHADSYLLPLHAGLSWKADFPQMGSSPLAKSTLCFVCASPEDGCTVLFTPSLQPAPAT